MRRIFALCLSVCLCGCGGSDGEDPPGYQVGFVNDSPYCLVVEVCPWGQATWSPWSDWTVPAEETIWRELPHGTYGIRWGFTPGRLDNILWPSLSGDPAEPVEIEPFVGTRAALGTGLLLRIGNRTRERIIPEVLVWAGQSGYWVPLSCGPMEHLGEVEVQVAPGNHSLRWWTRGAEGWVVSQEVPISGEEGDTVSWVWS